MLPLRSVVEGKIQNQLGVQCMGHTAERRQARLVLSALEPGDRRLRHAAASTQLSLGKAMLDPEGDEPAGNPLVRLQVFERRFVRWILAKLAVQV